MIRGCHSLRRHESLPASPRPRRRLRSLRLRRRQDRERRSCRAGGAAAAVAALSVPAVTSASVAHATAIAATATDKSGAPVSGAAVTWSVADASVATVDANGGVTPLRAGFTTISASSNGITASGMLSVRGSAPLPARSKYVGTNLSGIAYYSPQFPFADLMKSGAAGPRARTTAPGARRSRRSPPTAIRRR